MQHKEACIRKKRKPCCSDSCLAYLAHVFAMPLQAVLPSVGFLWIAYMRRERALDELAKGGGMV